MTRTVLIRSACELWAEGRNYTELCHNIENIPKAFISPFLSTKFTYKVHVGSFNKKISNKEKVKKIESLPLDDITRYGTVNLSAPDHTFVLQEYYGYGKTNAPDHPYNIYFGRWITDGQRDKIQDYHLQNRHFLGNTSMEAGLSLIMANLAKVDKNSLVFDPFVGTGSLLVACAHFGSYVMGTDIDYPLLHAKAKPSRHKQKKRAADESIRSNLKQYGFESQYIDALVADASKHHMWRHQSMFDVIITDPPYGIREATQKIGPATENYVIEDDVREGHVAQRSQYGLSDIFKDLLNFAARYLRLHGRIVFWFPVVRREYSEANIAKHPCLHLISNCEQILNTKVARRLITMEKMAECTDVENSADYDIDHYGEASFRERYFHKNKGHDTITDDVEHSQVNMERVTIKDT
ncbi:tRNA (guanine(10)-N2)-methyltransferase homolog isoform X2 [Gigantopelta aegis]|nr:tRNA (guanine(10)-N2)-methyltransferase homolog isoform X2 [Gigantopelta aegis]